MAYLLDQQISPITLDGKLIDMFIMSSRNLEIEYHITLKDLIKTYGHKEINDLKLVKKN